MIGSQIIDSVVSMLQRIKCTNMKEQLTIPFPLMLLMCDI